MRRWWRRGREWSGGLRIFARLTPAPATRQRCGLNQKPSGKHAASGASDRHFFESRQSHNRLRGSKVSIYASSQARSYEWHGRRGFLMEFGNKKAKVRAAVRAALAAPPKRPPVRALVVEMLPDLLRLRAHGYSHRDIADIFSAKGLKIAASTLKNYLNEAKAAPMEATPTERATEKPRDAPSPARRAAVPLARVAPVIADDGIKRARAPQVPTLQRTTIIAAALKTRLSDRDV